MTWGRVRQHRRRGGDPVGEGRGGGSSHTPLGSPAAVFSPTHPGGRPPTWPCRSLAGGRRLRRSCPCSRFCTHCVSLILVPRILLVCGVPCVGSTSPVSSPAAIRRTCRPHLEKCNEWSKRRNALQRRIRIAKLQKFSSENPKWSVLKTRRWSGFWRSWNYDDDPDTTSWNYDNDPDTTSWNNDDDPEYHIMQLWWWYGYHIMKLWWWSGIPYHETLMMIRNTTSWNCDDDPEYHIMKLWWWSGIPHHQTLMMIRNTTPWNCDDDPEYHIMKLW